MYVERCIFYEGEHICATENCYHTQTEDEQGPIAEVGWTVQSGNTKKTARHTERYFE